MCARPGVLRSHAPAAPVATFWSSVTFVAWMAPPLTPPPVALPPGPPVASRGDWIGRPSVPPFAAFVENAEVERVTDAVVSMAPPRALPPGTLCTGGE